MNKNYLRMLNVIKLIMFAMSFIFLHILLKLVCIHPWEFQLLSGKQANFLSPIYTLHIIWTCLHKSFNESS